MNEDHSLFLEAMADVTPCRQTDKVPLPKPGAVSPGQAYRREAAQRALDDENFLPTTFIEPVPPHAEISFRRQGVQREVFRKFSRGEYPVEALLDLHRKTVAQARREVYHFIQECLQDETRTALIIHGKGGNPKTGKNSPALLKSCLAKWLPLLPEVLAFHSAQKCHGGTGAVYIMLKKSPRQKERNRRRFAFREGEKP